MAGLFPCGSGCITWLTHTVNGITTPCTRATSRNPSLTKTAHPILRVPGSHNFPVFAFMNINDLNGHGPVFCRQTQESFSLCACHFGADDDLVSVLEHILDRQMQIRKRCGKPGEQGFHSCWSGGLVGSGRNINPVLAQDAVEERRVFRVEGLIPQGDVLLVRIPLFRMGGRTQEEGETEQGEYRRSHTALP